MSTNFAHSKVCFQVLGSNTAYVKKKKKKSRIKSFVAPELDWIAKLHWGEMKAPDFESEEEFMEQKSSYLWFSAVTIRWSFFSTVDNNGLLYT